MVKVEGRIPKLSPVIRALHSAIVTQHASLPLNDRPPPTAGNARHTPDRVHNQWMADCPEQAHVSPTIAIGITATQTQPLLRCHLFGQPTFAFSVRKAWENVPGIFSARQ